MAWLGIECSSSWIKAAESGTVGDAAAPPDVLAKSHKDNYDDLGSSDAILVMRVPDSGETFFEAAHAIWKMTIPIIWMGTPVLSAKMAVDRVKFASSRLEALTMLASLVKP
jgi:hypothetical protein